MLDQNVHVSINNTGYCKQFGGTQDYKPLCTLLYLQSSHLCQDKLGMERNITPNAFI